MKHSIRRLSVFVALIMVAALLPISAFAAGTAADCELCFVSSSFAYLQRQICEGALPPSKNRGGVDIGLMCWQNLTYTSRRGIF